MFEFGYWTETQWILGVALFTAVLALSRLSPVAVTWKNVLIWTGVSFLAYTLPAAVAAVRDPHNNLDWLLAQFYLSGNGNIALVLALSFLIFFNRRDLFPQPPPDPDEIYLRYRTPRGQRWRAQQD